MGRVIWLHVPCFLRSSTARKVHINTATGELEKTWTGLLGGGALGEVCRLCLLCVSLFLNSHVRVAYASRIARFSR